MQPESAPALKQAVCERLPQQWDISGERVPGTCQAPRQSNGNVGEVLGAKLGSLVGGRVG